MKRLLLLAGFVGFGSTWGCAHTGVEGGGGYCGIAEPEWHGAVRDYDRATTLETIAGLRQYANSDRVKSRTGARGDVGGELDELFRRPAPEAFIARGVTDLGVRLRQLDCGVRGGRVPVDQADALYAEILGQLGSEQAALDPSGVAAHRPSAP